MKILLLMSLIKSRQQLALMNRKKAKTSVKWRHNKKIQLTASRVCHEGSRLNSTLYNVSYARNYGSFPRYTNWVNRPIVSSLITSKITQVMMGALYILGMYGDEIATFIARTMSVLKSLPIGELESKSLHILL